MIAFGRPIVYDPDSSGFTSSLRSPPQLLQSLTSGNQSAGFRVDSQYGLNASEFIIQKVFASIICKDRHFDKYHSACNVRQWRSLVNWFPA